MWEAVSSLSRPVTMVAKLNSSMKSWSVAESSTANSFGTYIEASGSSATSRVVEVRPSRDYVRRNHPDGIGIQAWLPASPASPQDAARDYGQIHTRVRSRYLPLFDS